MSEPSTPLMRQYAAVKKEHPTALVFFRLGDFYELFFDDAIVAAKELQITLTSRNKEKGIAVPMCGVPYHAAEGYIGKLIRKGFKVAICEQMEDPRLAKKLVRREVTRVVTPGTAADSSLGSEENNFLAALAEVGDRVGFAALDLSTGDFRATEFSGDGALRRVQEELEQLRPKELLYGSAAPLFERGMPHRADMSQEELASFARQDGRGRPSPHGLFHCTETPLDDWIFAPDHAIPLLENHFGVLSLEGFGLAGKTAAASAAGAILYYVRSTQRGSLDHIDRIGWYERQNCLVLDAVTVRNLELIEPLFAGADAGVTLIRSIDAAVTPMGKRLLRAWLLRPSLDMGEINGRLDAVAAGVKDIVAREELRRALDGVLDLERLLSRVTLETANPRDVLALAASLARIPAVKAALGRLAAERLKALHASLDELRDLTERIVTTIVPEPPLTFADGGVIAAGVDRDLDELRELSRNSKQVLAQIEQRERGRTGITSLKVKFNSIFGYYIEVSKSNLHLAPPEYERKQTLVGAERFTTPELKEYEVKILDAQEKIVEIERRLFTELRTAIAAEARRIRHTALALAEVDVLASLAHIAALRNYCRPELLASGDGGDIEIIEGRHPVIEQQEMAGGTERFVPNDLYMNGTTDNILLLTGPNMGGKSTYLRQTALIVILAQMGSFVAARSARLSVVDRVFTRIGASDNLARGRSTFMVEMTETAAILHTATPRSLILLDEVGRGTATYDGLAIAWAAVEYLHARVRAKTLFATHYFELTELAEQLSGVKNYHVSVKETGGGIVFLRKVEPGAADRSYGIEVAKLAGLPQEVVTRAREVLLEHEFAEQQATAHLSPGATPPPAQLTIFTPLSQPVLDKLREVDLNRLTPLEALNLLAELKKEI
ncbi:DNA mismatch repair protein MutS [Candidatus Sulfotelmatobacter kueseliae]|uniref:DNA mismatch repair protein MutS n=1 Tax=Candidatus Sulfotelmatobacter kueseliae TaxID=2042962 RepID=A0A2U3K1Z4_9BACT|nr:DNA mismatch repair protein MutS [Candidatus Sulfotelmatobacter kueseliae]